MAAVGLVAPAGPKDPKEWCGRKPSKRFSRLRPRLLRKPVSALRHPPPPSCAISALQPPSVYSACTLAVCDPPQSGGGVRCLYDGGGSRVPHVRIHMANERERDIWATAFPPAATMTMTAAAAMAERWPCFLPRPGTNVSVS